MTIGKPVRCLIFFLAKSLRGYSYYITVAQRKMSEMKGEKVEYIYKVCIYTAQKTAHRELFIVSLALELQFHVGRSYICDRRPRAFASYILSNSDIESFSHRADKCSLSALNLLLHFFPFFFDFVYILLFPRSRRE